MIMGIPIKNNFPYDIRSLFNNFMYSLIDLDKSLN